MKPSQVTQSLKVLYRKRRPGFIWGAPGAGKSAVVKKFTVDEDLDMVDIRLSMLDPTDLKGFPIADREKEVMRWLQADFLPHDPKWKGIIFFDEANSAPKAVEAPMYQLTLDRKLGDYKLPDGASIMLAGNRETDRAIANRMSSALMNRLVHIEYEVNLDDWLTWAIKHGKVVTEFLAFMRFRPELLHKFNPNSKAWPSPRSWEFANELLNSGLDQDTEFELLKGTVGDGPASEFIAYMKVFMKIPTAEKIFANPEKALVPKDEPDQSYAIATMLAEHTKRENFGKAIKYIERMTSEYQIVYIRDVVRREIPIENTKEFVNWSLKNSEVLTGGVKKLSAKQKIRSIERGIAVVTRMRIRGTETPATSAAFITALKRALTQAKKDQEIEAHALAAGKAPEEHGQDDRGVHSRKAARKGKR